MLVNLPVEITLLICEYPEFKDLGQLAWTNKRMMQIIRKYRPIVLVLEGKTLFYHFYSKIDDEEYEGQPENRMIHSQYEGRIYLFNSHTYSAEEIAKFHNCYASREVATTQNKILGISGIQKSFEIYDLDTRRISRGPDPPEWRRNASVAYFKDKLYYLGGMESGSHRNTNRVDILINGKWQAGPAFPLPVYLVQTITCDETLYVIDGHESRKIYRLSDDEWEWIEIGEIPERRTYFVIASLNGRIYIVGGWNRDDDTLKSCLCFDPSAPVDSRISPIADMNYAREHHSLIVANEKLFAIGGRSQNAEKRSDNSYISCWPLKFYNVIEEYDPRTNKWREVGKLT